MDESFETQEIEVVKKMEDEHLRLQRQFRTIQTDRQQRTMGVHPQFRSQDQLMRTLKKEYINLMKDLKIARSGRHKKNDKKMKSDLQRALMHRIHSDINCQGGYSMMENLDGLLQINTKEMIRLKKLVIANQGEVDFRRCQSEHRLMSSENKLESAKLRFNTIQYENKKIREEIEHMLKDRFLFKQSWDKMLGALGKGKKFLSDLFESSTLAYDQRDEWCYKLRSVMEKGKMDQSLQVQEMRDLRKAYDHEMKIYDFLAKKGVTRINKRQERREVEEKQAKEDAENKKLDEHVKLLDDINDFAQEDNYRKIIDNFVRQECRNFSTYKLLTDYCAENVVLRKDLISTRRDVEDRRDWKEMKTLHYDGKIEVLQKELEELKARTQEVRRKKEEQDELMGRIVEKIHGMFQMLDCSLEPFQNLLGDKQPSLYTMKLTLLLMSEKIKEYTESVYYCEKVLKRKERASESKSSSRLKKYTVRVEPHGLFDPIPLNLLVPADPCPSCVETRWLSRVMETVERPFDHQQVLEAIKALSVDPAYLRSDRVHALVDCRATASRRLLANRYT